MTSEDLKLPAINYIHLQTACRQMLVSRKALYNPIINYTNVPPDRRMKLTHYCLHIYFCFYRQMFVLKKAICNLNTNFTKMPTDR